MNCACKHPERQDWVHSRSVCRKDTPKERR
jgi:hypothetical protein